MDFSTLAVKQVADSMLSLLDQNLQAGRQAAYHHRS